MADDGPKMLGPRSGLSPEARDLLTRFVGKRLARFAQGPNEGDFDSGDWRDDEPLELTFEDGSVLRVYASGWHASGGLWVEAQIP